MTSQQKT